jgi:hypothetical protein
MAPEVISRFIPRSEAPAGPPAQEDAAKVRLA